MHAATIGSTGHMLLMGIFTASLAGRCSVASSLSVPYANYGNAQRVEAIEERISLGSVQAAENSQSLRPRLAQG